MSDIIVILECYKRSDFEFLGWRESNYNSADGFTKLDIFPMLLEFLSTGKLDLKILTIVDRTFAQSQLKCEEDLWNWDKKRFQKRRKQGNENISIILKQDQQRQKLLIRLVTLLHQRKYLEYILP